MIIGVSVTCNMQDNVISRHRHLVSVMQDVPQHQTCQCMLDCSPIELFWKTNCLQDVFAAPQTNT